MNQIDLFNKQKEEEQALQNESRINKKRPQKINTSKVVSANHKWKQCKIIGKNISIRSYSAACVFENKLFVYGGYQILNGLMSDFSSIDLDDKLEKFNWEAVVPNQECLPGTRAKHGLVSTKEKIYLIGGLHSDIHGSNDFFAFDPKTKQWEHLNPVGDRMPKLDSFGCVLAERDGDEVILVAGGYNSDISGYSNALYEYNIAKNKISVLFQGSKDTEKYPKARSGMASTSDGKNMYIFGGKDDESRMNDLWQFNLSQCKFHRMQDGGHLPAIRNGHSMIYHEDKLYVFGGIHDITWELDDLQIYSLTKREWITLEQDSARKVDRKSNTLEVRKQKSPDEKKGKKKSWYDTAQTLYGNKSNMSSPLQKNTSYRDDEANKSMSPGKMIEEQKKKVFFQKKAELLRAFEISEGDKKRYIEMETSSQAMRNSLDVIGNPNPKSKVPEGRLTDFGKESISKFLEPLQNNNNLIVGKRPCARDGHCAVLIDNQLIIFGGDRHQMSFNDIYKLNLTLAKKQIEF